GPAIVTARATVRQAAESCCGGRANSSRASPPITTAAASCHATVSSGRPHRATAPASAITVGAAAPLKASAPRHASSAAGTAAQAHRRTEGGRTDTADADSLTTPQGEYPHLRETIGPVTHQGPHTTGPRHRRRGFWAERPSATQGTSRHTWHNCPPYPDARPKADH